ncbi:unnamed protein product [Hymenolepis diminuta]|uniref:TMF_TATA_bd domain-containing protein n=1 Tax=Hymenolepis diminuta TaxID=6216 RepID=A0A0R3SXZ7_HYMDI|nr:unnamed protein product [Hymenolepis diminuta]
MEVNDTESEVNTKCESGEQQTVLNKEESQSQNEYLDTNEKENELQQLNGHKVSALHSGDYINQTDVDAQSKGSNSSKNASDAKGKLLNSTNLGTKCDNNIAQNDFKSCSHSDNTKFTSAEPGDLSMRLPNEFNQSISLPESSTSRQASEVDKVELPVNLKEVTSPKQISSDNSKKWESSLQENGKEYCQIISASNSQRIPNDSYESSPKIPSVDSPVLAMSTKPGNFCEKTNINKGKDLKLPTVLESVTTHEDSKNLKLDILEASDIDSVSNLSSFGDLESLNEVDFLQKKVKDLTEKLLRSQQQMEGLLEEKQKWLSTRSLTQQKQPPSNQKTSVSSDTAAIVVKFAQSEQQRMKAENRIKELEAMISRMQPVGSKLPVPTEQSGPMKELNKALTEARERAENLRHSLKQEEARVSDLNAKLTATREAHRNEQKRAAGQMEVISKLNRDIDILKRQLKDMGKIREREAKRLCDEMTVQETMVKYNKALAEITTLKDRIAELEEVKQSKIELEVKYEELQHAHDNLVSVREEMASCVERETQLSEFTRRLTERTAGLQSAHLAAQERLAASEKAVAEASRAAHEATELLQATEARARSERAEAAATITQLETKISKLTESEASLKAELARQQVEKAALKRKQNGLDRELARLVAQQRKRSTQELRQQTSQKSDNVSEKSPMGSNLSLSVVSDEKLPPSPAPFHTSEAVQDSTQTPPLGNALLVSSVPLNVNCGLTTITPDMSSISALEVQTLEPNRNLLLNKIDRLQRTNVRLMEKIDFMHEHIGQLTQELQKKTKILQVG